MFLSERLQQRYADSSRNWLPQNRQLCTTAGKHNYRLEELKMQPNLSSVTRTLSLQRCTALLWCARTPLSQQPAPLTTPAAGPDAALCTFILSVQERKRKRSVFFLLIESSCGRTRGDPASDCSHARFFLSFNQRKKGIKKANQ